jgi:hypothetical protein
MTAFRSLGIAMTLLVTLAGCSKDKDDVVADSVDCSKPGPVTQTVNISSTCTVGDQDRVALCTHRTDGSVDQVRWCQSDASNYDVDFSQNFLGMKDGSGKPHKAPFQDETNPVVVPAGTTRCTAPETPRVGAQGRHPYVVRKDQKTCLDPKVIFK